MSETTWNLVSQCLRDILYNQLTMSFMVYLLYQTCEPHQRPRWRTIVLLLELRSASSICIMDVAWFYHGQETWYPLLIELYSLLHGILIIFVLHCFGGHLGKTLLAGFWTETFAVGCHIGSWLLAYWGTGEIYVMVRRPLHPRDALMTLFYVPLCVLCTKALAPALRFYRNYHFKHPQWLTGIGLLIMFSRIPINIYSALPRATYQLMADQVLCNLITVLLAIVLMKQAKLRKEIYREQQRSVEAHLSLLQQQAVWVTDSRTQLDEQIAVVESLPREKQGELVSSYLEELKAQYHTFLAGMRCKDQLVDALLCYKEELCRQQGISTEFSMQQYDRGELEEQEVAALLLTLFDGAIHSCQKKGKNGYISLHMALLKGQLVVEMNYSGKQKLEKEGIRPILARHDGAFFQERTKTGWRTKILLQAGQMP